MAENKTKQTEQSVEEFINTVADEQKRKDCFTILKLMQEATKEKPKMWGTSIIGFGSYHYKYDSGHEGDICVTGFSPRKQNLTLYIVPGFEQPASLLKKLGKHKLGKSCLYINRLADVDMEVLKELITKSVAVMQKKRTSAK